MATGKAFIFSAPSGSGKTTIVKHLLKTNNNLEFSISACTRDKRGRNEKNGQDYHFLTTEEFKQKIDDDAFIEWEEVYPGNFYGTLKSEIERIWQSGKSVIFDVDVKGGLSLKQYFKEQALAIFVRVPSLEVLSDRLGSRASETPESLSQRLYKARFELEFEDKFDLTILNSKLETSLAEAQRAVDDFLTSSK
jgi:guanylate kinase